MDLFICIFSLSDLGNRCCIVNGVTVTFSCRFLRQHKYPIGSGRVTFNNAKSYMKAVAAAFIEIKTQARALFFIAFLHTVNGSNVHVSNVYPSIPLPGNISWYNLQEKKDLNRGRKKG